jgi:hypothetical protein
MENGPAACDGTYVGEAEVIHSIANYLDREFFALDGPKLADRAGRDELTAADLPEAFAKIKALLAPPKQPAADRKRAEKQAVTLTQQIDKALANLVLLDPENIPAAQERIRKLREELELLQAELRKRPPSESDVNAEALAVLRALWWLGHLFRSAAQEAKMGDDPADPRWEEFLERAREQNDDRPVAVMTGAARTPAVRAYLRHITGIEVFTKIVGTGKATRHVLQEGRIAVAPVWGKPKEGNLRDLGQSQAAYR